VRDAVVRDLEGREQPIPAAFEGKPAIVALWATWCSACRKEMPALVELDAWARAHGVTFVAIAVGEPRDRVTSFTRQRRLPYPVWIDEDFRLAETLGETRVPSTFVLDRFGRVAYSGGAVDETSMLVLKHAAAR